MTTYTVKIRVEERWDGSDEDAAHIGYGDYVNNRFETVGTVEAETKRKAQSIARKLIKEATGWSRVYFSGVGYNAVLRPIDA